MSRNNLTRLASERFPITRVEEPGFEKAVVLKDDQMIGGLFVIERRILFFKFEDVDRAFEPEFQDSRVE